MRENTDMANREANSQPASPSMDWPHARLRKHADYQRVYKAGRKQSSPSMSYFFRLRTADELTPGYTGPRVGLTAGRVLGKAVDRNRIKRRMREAARANLALLPQFADVVLHPRRLVLTVEFARLEREVAKVFSTVSAQSSKARNQEGAQA
ncbi:MAG TPA: ribonuclease P protein component [Acidobacteriaceae bacterium]|nr:ribonuclease P protein component [Acidobacteriaceae bacterium]